MVFHKNLILFHPNEVSFIFALGMFSWETWKILHPNQGLRTPNEAFFLRNPKLFGLGRQFGQKRFAAFGVFSANLSAPILVLWVPCPYYTYVSFLFLDWRLTHWEKQLTIKMSLFFSRLKWWEFHLRRGCKRSNSENCHFSRTPFIFTNEVGFNPIFKNVDPRPSFLMHTQRS